MKTLNLLQTIIHKLESSQGLRYARFLVLILVTIVLLIRYDVHCYHNMSAPAAMDAAQLARNISEGRGFTTQFVRPLSIYLVTKQNHESSDKDRARLNSGHPDIANPPVYPVVLAGLMKVLPFHYDAGLKGPFWSLPDAKSPGGRRGLRYQPDFLITLFNQFLFLVVLMLVFFWARRLFDVPVARLSFVLLLGAEVLWRFSASGLSTMLLLLIFMGVIWCLTFWEAEAREPKWGVKGLVILSVAAGALAGVGGLTRYAFMPMILPVVVFLGVFGGARRMLYCVTAIAAFAVVVAPWIARNYAVSGTPFGTASFSVIESFSSGFKLERSLQPDLPHYVFLAYMWKLSSNLMPVLQDDLFKMAGGWISAFFLVSLMVGFRSLALRRMRYFLVGCIVTLAVTEALVRTQLTDETPEINSENLLVLLAPVIVVYGVGLFYVLLEGIKFPFFQLRYVAITVFAGLLLLPMLFALVAGTKGPVAYPPYRPDVVQFSSQLMKPDELIMSDIPWAVAWYGDRQSVWLTLNATASPQDPVQWQESFFAINDVLKPIHALYLTPRSLDARFQSEWVRGGQLSWGHFIAGILINGQVPSGFPLTKIPPGYLPEQAFLCDWVRW
jgi:4-amino-4-deoxy-L-arabinose transferase-like glycosyltransferase